MAIQEHFMPDQRMMTVESRNGLYVAQFIESGMPFSEGSIRPPAEYDNDQSRLELLRVVVDSLQEVSPAEKPYSGCTDGRIPVKLESGEPIPVREKLVGADMLTGLFMADSLGDRFYANPNAPVEERLEEVAEFLRNPCTHVPCGAGDGFPVVSANVPRFARDPAFKERNGLFVPAGVFDERLFDRVVEGAARREANGAYAGYNPRMIDGVVRRITGPRGIAYLREDERGVHGHVEEFIVDIQIPDVAGDEAAVAAATGDREVFWQNDTRLEELARRFGRGNDEDYAIAYIAGRAWTDAGHGTLSKDLRTAVVTRR